MRQKVTILAAALNLGQFDIDELAEAAGAPRDTAQTVVSRRTKAWPGWVSRLMPTYVSGPGRPAVRYELTESGRQRLISELAGLTEAARFRIVSPLVGLRPSGLTLAREALDELREDPNAADLSTLLPHISRLLDWAHNELREMPEEVSRPFLWELAEMRADVQGRVSALMQERWRQYEGGLTAQLPSRVVIGRFGVSRGADLMCRSARTTLNGAFAAWTRDAIRTPDIVDVGTPRCLESDYPRRLRRNVDSLWRIAEQPQGAVRFQAILLCLNSAVDAGHLSLNIRSLVQPSRGTFFIILDRSESLQVAAIAKELRIEYTPRAEQTGSWVRQLLQRFPFGRRRPDLSGPMVSERIV